MSNHDPSKIDQLLDLLLDALQERQTAREDEKAISPMPEPEENTAVEPTPPPPDDIPVVKQLELQEEEPITEFERETAVAEAADEPFVPEKVPTIHLDRMLSRLVLILLLLIVLVNIPFNRHGTNLARAVPDEQSLVIRDGLVLKGKGEKIYVLENNHKRWISSLDAFEYYGFRWEQVNLVDDTFLERFPDGPALSVLNKCSTSPHVYAIENGLKRWIKDIPTFEAEGYVWEDVQIVSCAALEEIPAGPPIPPDAGEPPKP